MADDITGLTDLISSMQREIGDLSITVNDHEQRITDNSSSIDVVESPPPGVPPELLAWYGAGHATREVDTLLDTDLSNLTTGVSTNAENISVVSDALNSEIADRTTNDVTMQSAVDDLQLQVTANLDTLNQEIADRSALSVTVSGQYDDANTRMDGIEANVATLATSGASSASSASAQIASMGAALQVQQTQILQLQGIGVDPAGAQASQITSLTIIANDAATAVAQETLDRQAADAALQTSVNTINSSLSGMQSGLDAEVSTRAAADVALSTELGALETSVSGTSGLIAAETASRIAADSALQVTVDQNTLDISTNAASIAAETVIRTDTDTSLQAQIDTNTANITGNISQITANTLAIGTINSGFGIVKDVTGYVTSWQQLDQLTAPGAFNLRDLNNNVRLKNPTYPGNYFPPVSVAAFSLPVTYDTTYGGATNNDFHGTNGNDYTRAIKVYSTGTIGLNGSIFKGPAYGTGGDPNRVGQVLTTFLVDFNGGVHRYLSVWYRIKNTPTDTSQRWFPVGLLDNTMAGQRTYEQINGKVVAQISVTLDKVIEFGVTVLNTLDASIADLTGNNIIYGGSVSVMAFNMVTIA